MSKKQKKRIAIFASGNGTNAEKILSYFKESRDIEVAILLTNNPSAPAIERARKFDVPVLVFNRATFYESTEIPDLLLENRIDLIVLAGFMWLIPVSLINSFPDKIINIHPALLPKYGGKGMYGDNVHKAVLQSKEKESGITIHYVNENYDEGNIIQQEKSKVDPQDTPTSLAAKIHLLEYKYYPKVIENILHK